MKGFVVQDVKMKNSRMLMVVIMIWHAAVPFLLSYLVFGFVLISLNLFGSIFYLIEFFI